VLSIDTARQNSNLRYFNLFLIVVNIHSVTEMTEKIPSSFSMMQIEAVSSPPPPPPQCTKTYL
jgi:hypothetical protein